MLEQAQAQARERQQARKEWSSSRGEQKKSKAGLSVNERRREWWRAAREMCCSERPIYRGRKVPAEMAEAEPVSETDPITKRSVRSSQSPPSTGLRPWASTRAELGSDNYRMASREVRVACVQLSPAFKDVQASIARADKLVSE